MNETATQVFIGIVLGVVIYCVFFTVIRTIQDFVTGGRE